MGGLDAFRFQDDDYRDPVPSPPDPDPYPDQAYFLEQHNSVLQEEITTLQARITELEAKAAAWDRLEALVKTHGNAQGAWIEIDCYGHFQIDAAVEWNSSNNLGNGSTLIEAVNAAGGE